MQRVTIILLMLICFSTHVVADARNEFNEAFKASGQADYPRALKLFKSGFERLEAGERLPHNDVLGAKIGLATVYIATGDIIKARQLVEPLAGDLEKNGPRDTYAASLQILYYVHFFSGQDQQALKKLQLLIPLQKELPQLFPAPAQAQTFAQLAFIQDKIGNTVEAVGAQQNAIKLYKQGLPDTLNEVVSAYTILVDYNEKLGEHAAALQALEDRLALMETQAKTYELDISNTRIRIQATKKRLAQQGPDVDNPYGTDLVELLARQTHFDVAGIQKNLFNTIKSYGENSPLTASGFMGYGDALSITGKTDYALQAYTIAHRKFTRLYGERSPNHAELYLKRANAVKNSVSFIDELSEEKRKSLIDDYHKSINIYADIYGDAHPATISSIQALYETERLQNDYGLIFSLAKRLFNAYSQYEKSSFTHLGRRQKLAFREQYKDITQRFIEASWLSQAKAPDESYFGEPYPTLDMERPDWKEHHEKKVAIYNEKIANKKSRKQSLLREAFEAWINHKGSINSVDNTLTLARQATTNESLRNRIDTFFQSRKQLAQLNSDNSDWEKRQAERKRLQSVINNTMTGLARDIPELASDNTITLENLKNRIPPNSIYLDFVKLYTYQYAVFSYDSNGEVRLARLGDSRITLEQRVKTIRNLINDTIDGTISEKRSMRLLKRELSELYKKTFGQIPGFTAGYNKLIISAEGLLALMPMGLLYDEQNKQYLIEKYSIRTVPSARILIQKQSFDQAKAKDAVIFADPDFDLGTNNKKLCPQQASSRALTLSVLKNFDQPCIGRLPATAVEANSINTILGSQGETYMQSDATEENLRKQHRPGILHIATHGFFLPDPAITNPLEKAGLILSGANTGIANKSGKGIVTGLKLASMDLQGTDLVVLSACETGVGDIEQGEGVAGLNQAFLRAGANGVVMSMWRVPDVETAELMRRFYLEINKGKLAADALRDAKREFIREGRHPLAWAAFVYSG